MAALNAARARKERDPKTTRLPVKAGAQIWQNGLVATVAGKAIAARVAASIAEAKTLRVVGLAAASVLGGALDGDQSVDVDRGVFLFANSGGGDAIVVADIGEPCFAADDQTVAKTVGAGLRAVAGVVFDVTAEGVWVLVGADTPKARRLYLSVVLADLRGAQAQVYRTVAPRGGAVTNIWSVTDGALATGDATLTGKIGAVNITGGVVTIAQAASAAGDVDSAQPTAANVVVEGDVISLTVGGANTAQIGARALIEISF